ncbi:PucR-like helix-turn-helix protein [Scopulibacillus darangshiensis]|uniref:PucR-like helix-turn-helix protein n=1 Tax=Scopulibacillus darangshiensis TaxID=442528 RepID=A0A4V2SMV2_9BACL|nr:helix-turn-helix domain-containing protein [Scopulibacillus darangshiensis]TCP28696.1 PucR-like helix-turn-helix protein [Scopulibacillus darangshiensis]
MNESYANAAAAIQAGELAGIKPSLYAYNDWRITLEVLPRQLSKPMKKKLMVSVEGLISQKDFSILAGSFIEYCRHNLNVSKAAEALYIHRNTLNYRLKRISRLTLLDIHSFEHCLLLYIALKCYQNCKQIKELPK